MQQQTDSILAALAPTLAGQGRIMLALAGAPGSGKSTLAEALCTTLNRQARPAQVVPMDGYHLDNAILDARGSRARKGAPHTFDLPALARDLARLRDDTGPVLVPVFDRALDLSRAAAREIGTDCRIVIVEGNYLLLDQPHWEALGALFDLRVFLSVPEPELEVRLVQRWLDHGHSPGQARTRALGNDIPNARLVVAHQRPADLIVNSY